MRWINKRNKHFRKKAHRIINHFIYSAWNNDEKRYIGLDFAGLKSIDKFKTLLYNEQHGYCCYCMRKLDLNRKNLCTIEHILPHKIKETDYNDIAFYYSHIPFFRKYVRVISSEHIIKKMKKTCPYPHFCAYENLVLSCSGAIYKTNEPSNEILSSLHECCNNKRGQDLILPIFFMKNMDIKYEKDGRLTFNPNNSELHNTIEALNLEGNENLRTIRRIWGNIYSIYSLEDVRKAYHDEKLRMQILLDTDLDHNLAKRFKNSLYWELVTEYEWFGMYFKKLENGNLHV